jgi:hypothetical protein
VISSSLADERHAFQDAQTDDLDIEDGNRQRALERQILIVQKLIGRVGPIPPVEPMTMAVLPDRSIFMRSRSFVCMVLRWTAPAERDSAPKRPSGAKKAERASRIRP